MAEHRRSQRKRAQRAIQVNNAMTGDAIGRIGNLSIDGMMMVASQPMRENALFQFTFHLPNTATGELHNVEIGVHEQWVEAANVPGQFWAGFRIIDISPEDYNVLYDWVNSPGGQFD